MPVLCERSDSDGCDVPRVDERDALCSRAVGEGALSYLLRVAEEVLHEVICSQDGIGNAALPDSPLSVAIPLREANDVVIGDFPGEFNDALHADSLGFSEKVLLVAPLVWRTRRDEKQCLDTLERSGKALGTLEVENCGLGPTLPKRRRCALAVNACTSRHPLVCELCNDMLPDLPAGSGNQDLAVFPHDAVVLCHAVLSSCFLGCPERNEPRRHSPAAATD